LATIYDIAKVAGVSASTVSRALSRPGYVAEETRERVLAAAERLGYRPNALARALIHGHSRTIAVLLPEPDGNPYYQAVIEEIDQRASAMGYEMAVTFLHETRRGGLAEALAALEDRRPAGYLVYGSGGIYAEYERGAMDAPVVWVCPAPGDAVTVVCPDEELGGYLATRHLLELGHRRIALVGAVSRGPQPGLREFGYARALEETGATPLLLGRSDGPIAGRELTAVALRDHPEATAIIARNDHTAFGVLRALHEAGVDVPRAFSVVGFDNIPLAAYATPPLTTVDMRAADTAEQAVDRLLGLVRHTGRPTPTQERVAPRLIARHSSGPAPSGAGGRRRLAGAGHGPRRSP
jgi:LacI family transcriptional regulator